MVETSEQELERPAPHVVVLFGANGDLAKRMIYPALAKLGAAGRLPEAYAVVGTGRHDVEDYAAVITESVDDESSDLAKRATFQTSDADDGADLAAAIGKAEQDVADEAGVDVSDVRRLVYLSVPPSSMTDIVAMLGREGITDRARLVVEKPFGTDLDSSRELDAAIKDVADEGDVFRVDHFLGKEAVQNVLALRFANRVFGSVWNRDNVSSVQIDVPETLGLEGRGSFYETVGALRDMVTTHLSQILGFVALEPPADLTAESVRDAKAAVFEALQPFTKGDTVYGQFDGYRDDEDVADDSDVETLVALTAYVDTDRWRGVPFHLRTGKAMADDRRTVTVRFREPDPALFGDTGDEGHPHELVLDLSDEAKVAVKVRGKRPGPELEVAPATLTLDYAEDFPDDHPLAAYERILLDVFHGDQLLFARADEVDRLWQVCQPLLDDPPETQTYAKDTWGPTPPWEKQG
ncbi:glucose-6-phosphate dehydrogenase [Nocardioides sp.]|uniref:glucose-6-phosphate dehydrogenase n=1 Tax=Nocardioides sp. TaxID=35761 RepID=UPI002720475A|nr:glucose-6-phosphate dehydrogenase [Nocardioides sp.]MDO9457609.1 glucose-6-phosphate dehydrogenase [Nocardioides sp.]